MIVLFIPGAGWTVFTMIIQPLVIGSHAASYTNAAAAMVAGLDPWTVGPPLGVYAGPPTMLLPYLPFTLVPEIVQRIVWVACDLAIASWALHRLRLPGYWLLFPPLFQTIVLGHPEVLVLALLLVANPLGGLAVLIKPYAVFPLIAEGRWLAIAIGCAAGAATVIMLPWAQFVADGSLIAANLARQAHSDSVFGVPLLMAVAILALAVLGTRRALWLAVPLLWPYAQLNYKTMSIPALSPIIAATWALPVPGATLIGVALEAGIRLAARRRTLPLWIRLGVEVPAALPHQPAFALPEPAQVGVV